jgi:hypothetical protein
MNLCPAERIRLLTAAAALACTAGCGSGDSAAPFEGIGERPAPTAERVEKTGSVSLALTRQGVEFDAFSWVVTGPNYSMSGSIDVSHSSTVSARIDGIPEASGYSITLSGTSVLPARATCSGSESFDITAGAVADVTVNVACR